MMQPELLDRRGWATRADLKAAVFAWIEAFYNPRRRHSALGYLKSRGVRGASYRRAHRGMIIQPDVSGEQGQAPLV